MRREKLRMEPYEIGVMNHGELQAQALALDQYQTHVEALATQPGSYVLPHWVYRELLSQDSARSKSLFPGVPF